MIDTYNRRKSLILDDQVANQIVKFKNLSKMGPSYQNNPNSNSNAVMVRSDDRRHSKLSN